MVPQRKDVLDFYDKEAASKRPVVCVHDSPTPSIGQVGQPIRGAPGQYERCNCEYRRYGTANLFVSLDAHKSWRHVQVTEQIKPAAHRVT